jgi:hypothetical protein
LTPPFRRQSSAPLTPGSSNPRTLASALVGTLLPRPIRVSKTAIVAATEGACAATPNAGPTLAAVSDKPGLKPNGFGIAGKTPSFELTQFQFEPVSATRRFNKPNVQFERFLASDETLVVSTDPISMRGGFSRGRKTAFSTSPNVNSNGLALDETLVFQRNPISIRSGISQWRKTAVSTGPNFQFKRLWHWTNTRRFCGPNFNSERFFAMEETRRFNGPPRQFERLLAISTNPISIRTQFQLGTIFAMKETAVSTIQTSIRTVLALGRNTRRFC